MTEARNIRDLPMFVSVPAGAVFAVQGEDGVTGKMELDDLVTNGLPGAPGIAGPPGAPGGQGAPGAAGAPGLTSYVHTAYSNAANGSVDFHVSDPTGRAYLGVYTDQTLADSANPALYTWSLIKGADGNNGVPGAPGANGQPTYIHTAYSTSPTGATGFHLSDPTGRTYLGLYTDQTLA